MPDTGLLALLSAALRGMLPPQAAVGGADPAHAPPLWPGEAIAAVPARLAEYAAGRAAARAAMAALGLPPQAVPMAADRAPVWPEGMVGSITHTGAIALCAIAHRADLAAIGIDIEPAEAVDPGLWPILCRDEELQVLDALPPDLRLAAATRYFCAKEATYKAQYPLTGMLFDFHRLSVTFSGAEFTARFTAPTGIFAAGATIGGRVAQAGGHVLAAVALSSPI